MHPVYNFIANVLWKVSNKKQAQWGELAEDKAHDIDFPQPSKVTVSSELYCLARNGSLGAALPRVFLADWLKELNLAKSWPELSKLMFE